MGVAMVCVRKEVELEMELVEECGAGDDELKDVDGVA